MLFIAYILNMSLPQKYSKKDKDKLTGKHFGELFLAE